MTSPSSSARQTPTATASWPIADVEEAGEVSRPEALLDLLLEAANEQHLAEEEKEPLVREGVALLLDPCHEPHATRAGRTIGP